MDSRISRGRRVDSVAVSRRLSKHSQGGGIKPGSRPTIGALAEALGAVPLAEVSCHHASTDGTISRQAVPGFRI